MSPAPLDLAGQKFGRLTVIGLVKSAHAAGNGRLWLCSCECGRQREVASGQLRAGSVTSCGCRRREVAVIYWQRRAREAESSRELSLGRYRCPRNVPLRGAK